jgi:hypothetical protein
MSDGRPFIPSWLDDAGLTPALFRVYCRISRRGQCTESLGNMAKGCRLERKTVLKVIPALLSLGLITKEDRIGRTSILRVGPIPIGTPGSPPPTDTNRHPTTHPKRHPRDLYQSAPHEGTPLKVLPKGENPSPDRKGDGAKKLIHIYPQEGERLIKALEVRIKNIKKDTSNHIKQVVTLGTGEKVPTGHRLTEQAIDQIKAFEAKKREIEEAMLATVIPE